MRTPTVFLIPLLLICITVGYRSDHTIASPIDATSIAQFGAKGNGEVDATDVFQQTLDALRPGDTLIVPAGTYRLRTSLHVRQHDVTLRGQGAILLAETPDDQAVVIEGDGVTLDGFVLHGVGSTRLTNDLSAKIVVRGRDDRIIGNIIRRGASAGVFLTGARDFIVSDNLISTTLADGIHITGGSRIGIVRENTVESTGDDLIAIVSYGDGEIASNILIENNTVDGNHWGRGISIIGGKQITIRGNAISNVQQAAGILVAQEESYQTYGASDILITHNIITTIEVPLAEGITTTYAQHAAIEINADDEAAIRQIAVRKNIIAQTGFGGLRALGDVCGVELRENIFYAIAGEPIGLQTNNCTPALFTCIDNIIDKQPVLKMGECNGIISLTKIGADEDRLPRK